MISMHVPLTELPVILSPDRVAIHLKQRARLLETWESEMSALAEDVVQALGCGLTCRDLKLIASDLRKVAAWLEDRR